MAPKKSAGVAPKAAGKAESKKPKKEEKKDEPRPEDFIPKVEPVNEKEFETRLEAVQAGIEELQKKQQDLNEKIKGRSGGKDDYQSQRTLLRQELDKWSALMDTIKSQKDALGGQIDEQKRGVLDMKNDLSKMKKSIGYTSEDDIDKRMREIEFKMSHDIISLKEEKAFMKELADLKKNRPKVSKVNDMEASLKSDDRGLNLREQVKALNEEMATYYLEKKRVSEQLKELNESRAKQTGDLPDLFNQREEINKQIQEKIKERQDIRAERKQKENEYYAYQAEIRKIRQERAMEERKQRQKEYEDRKRQQKADKLDDQPFVAEMALIEQCMLFCKSLSAPKESQAKEEKKETVYDHPDTHMVLMKKEDREEEMYFAPTKAKKNKSKDKGGKSDAKKTIKHNAETFNLFDKLKLDAPLTTDDIPSLMEKLEEQLDEYKKKVADWEEQREERKRKILAGEEDEEEEKDDAEKTDGKPEALDADVGAGPEEQD